MAKSQQEAERWEQLENDAAKHHREALDQLIQATVEVVEFAKVNNLLRWEIINVENELAKVVQAKNSCYHVQRAGLKTEACMTSQTMRLVEPMFTPVVNAGNHRFDVEQETVHNCGRSIAPAEGQGIPDYTDTPSEQYNGIVHMIQ